ncbi:MAG: NADH-quinone oxidoreductase subunit L [Fibrobacter sp.]|uniref:NADH-quinone oxidoreductase subunit L n=1 Tax=uncultured Fibrobacter sp. TaxID=261512 RepID=UPI001567537F|nr:NADH-quinone oxidoreductase subunit L [uncultured Fibrobacter sp.]MBQ1824671.1 NADH-quinone oxidoreductase subunit L [Fibrobacter sp.]MBR6318123.1 NADH-quinone oxidoreductase subunit L [Fibrobacter sp.]
MTNLPLWLIPLFPLVATILLGTIAVVSSGGKKGAAEGIVGALAVLFPAMSFAVVAILAYGMPEAGIRETLCNWIDIPLFKADIGFMFDGLSRIMLLFVTGIGTLITMYSIGYMHGDRGFARFFAYINLFLFSMIVLVLSDNLLLTFLGWEGVGLCSYLLIGFWNKDVNNCKAANKAFIVNRVGDIGFLLGMLCLVTVGGSGILNYDALTSFIQMIMTAGHVEIVLPVLSLTGLLFFIGCTGKSAQIPLLTWLPDAMAGPTPVSALIHAATMVTSGVYLLARLGSMFAILPVVLDIITVIGMLTAFWAAMAGLFQNDIKKVLAYSTISQLGYMFMAAGVCAFDASIFHVFTHAFFKAALFLGAGAVIHALAGEQDMRKMGGLVKKTPVTACVMIFAFFAIIGFPGFAGFWSKDLILERLFMSGPMGPAFYVIGLFTAVITAVYMGRLIILTFFGEYRGSKESEEHIHEAPACMLLPMVILAFGAIFAGYLWADSIGITFFRDSLAPVVGSAQAYAATMHSAAHVNPMIFAGLGTLAALLGMFIAYKVYGNARVPAAKGSSAPEGRKATWTFFFDYVHKYCGIIPVQVLAWICDVVVDKILQATQWTLGAIATILGDGATVIQVRKVRLQVAFSVAGVAALVLVVLLTGGLI